jgi:hypothetical protein
MSLADILLTKSLALIIELHNLEPGTFRRHVDTVWLPYAAALSSLRAAMAHLKPMQFTCRRQRHGTL